MYLQQIRNATIFLCYGGKKFLIDPVLCLSQAYKIPIIALPSQSRKTGSAFFSQPQVNPPG